MTAREFDVDVDHAEHQQSQRTFDIRIGEPERNRTAQPQRTQVPEQEATTGGDR